MAVKVTTTMLTLIFYFSIIFNIKYDVCLGSALPEIKTRLGILSGIYRTSIDGRKYAAFEGVPYAQPPVGNLRFEDPLPVKPWSKVREVRHTRFCLQQGSPNKGEEDCLYLNIYVPADVSTGKINPDDKFGVVVFIHGGGFTVGSGNMDFLSTGDDVIPGNYGFKDQVRALKWVKRNIHYFGGKNDSILIAGTSAGGASVHLHYLSPLSKGLFERGLSQGGNALDPWVIKRNPLEKAKKLAASVDCDTISLEEMKMCLKEKPASLLAEPLEEFYGYDKLPIAPFGPVIERNSKDAFLTEDPYVLLKEKRVLDVPWIVATTADEGLQPKWYKSDLEEIDEEWNNVAHYLLDYNETLPISRREEVAIKIKERYLGPGERFTKENFANFTKIFTDRLYTIGAEIAAKLQARANKSPVYYYLFNYKKVELWRSPDDPPQGVAHGEDAIFFYGIHLSKLSKDEKEIKNACQNVLYTYSTTGVPSFDEAVEWLPTRDFELTYLNVTGPNDITLQKTTNLTPIKFWKDLGLLEWENLNVKEEL